MSLAFGRIASRLFNQPHLYDPRKAEAFLTGLGPTIVGAPVTIVNGEGGIDHAAFSNGRPSAGVLGDRLGRRFDKAGVAPFDVIDGVAVIAVEGTLVQKGGWVGSDSGETSYEGLQVQIARARSSAAVKAAVFEIDSFGGMVNGGFETAAALRQLSKEKPTLAILTDYAYSAGYLLASQARQIVMPEFGGAGSIGVVIMHADFSGNLEKEGIKVTFIHAGRHKVEGNRYQALPEHLRERWQGEVEAMRERFAETVARARGKRLTKAAALKTEADAFSAADAVRLGLADAVGDPQEAFAEFIAEVKRSRP